MNNTIKFDTVSLNNLILPKSVFDSLVKIQNENELMTLEETIIYLIKKENPNQKKWILGNSKQIIMDEIIKLREFTLVDLLKNVGPETRIGLSRLRSIVKEFVKEDKIEILKRGKGREGDIYKVILQYSLT